jgi:SAM-dependent methyltransferase
MEDCTLKGGQLIENWDELYDGYRIPQWEDLEVNIDFCFLISKYCTKDMRILEVGAGLGHNAIYLADKGFDITASDVSPNAVARCSDMAHESNVNLRTKVIDVTVPTSEQYDLIYEKGCWHTFFDPSKRSDFARAIALMLPENGYWISACGSADNLDDQNDSNLQMYPRLRLSQIVTAVENYFEVVEVKKGCYGTKPALDFITWECVFKKRANMAVERDCQNAAHFDSPSPLRVCRAWHETSRVKVPIPGLRRAEG